MNKKRGVFVSLVGLKCPQCREGELFKNPGIYALNNMFDMHENCQVCGLKFEQEPGFWWGAMYVSYALAVATSLPTFLFLYLLAGISFWSSFIAIIFLQIVLVPVVFRLSRSIWIYMMGSYRSMK